MSVSRGKFLSKLLSGDLAPFGGPAVNDELAGYLRAEQLALVKRHSSGMMLANVCNATVLMVAMLGSQTSGLASVWGGLLIFVASFCGLRSRQTTLKEKPQSVSRQAIHRLLITTVVLGSLWAMIPGFFLVSTTHSVQLLIVSITGGMMAGGALAFSTLPIAAIAFLAPIMVGIVIGFVLIGEPVGILVVIVASAYTMFLLRGVFLHAFELMRRVLQRIAVETAIRHDVLTQLSNRVAFNERLLQSLERLHLTGNQFAIVLIDLDRFKEVNDQYGHPAGDEYLTQIATRLRRSTRESDMVARIGGDEFALIVADLGNADSVFTIAEQVREIFAEPFVIEGRSLTGHASLGISLAPRDGSTPDDLMKHADIALYRAKKNGPGTIRFFEPGDDETARDRHELLHDLEGAVARDELFLVYQPILNLTDDRIAGFEALLRWNHPRRGLIAPNQFISLAEESGLIHPIGDWVIRQACADLARWPSDIRIAVNFSVAQLQNANVLPGVIGALAASGVSPNRLEIEITESMLISKYATAAENLKSLLSLGMTVALDDFGTGFSSLTYLRNLPFSHIKIDQSFVADMLVQPDSAAIVKSVLSLASDMNIGVVAEGIETAEQLAYFKGTSCKAAQGYFIGKPMPAAQASALLGVATESSSQAA